MPPPAVDATRVVADPNTSVLASMARAALAGASVGGVDWPQLDLADPRQRAFGDYELLEEIGRGGMGVVYRARQRTLERDVAIKFIADWFADPARVGRFLAEARAAARLLHPNIVQVYEVGATEGLHYFSMPLVTGPSLAQVLDEGPLTARAAIDLLLQLCDAMDYAHRLGLLHLDLKPANVLLGARGEPLVADFGLARHMDAQGGVDAQEVSGTPSFMAPEQILIKQYRLTPATDLYALGALLYRCLTGSSPHGEGHADEVIRRAAAGRIRPLRELDPAIPRDLAAVCMKCLELQPADRYASVARFADDLRRARDGLPVSVRRLGLGERVQRWLRREPRLALTAGAAVLALLVGAIATTWQWREAAAQRDRARLAGEIGAHLFAARGGGEADDDGRRAEDLVDWLHRRLPGDEARQAQALSDFAGALGPDAEGLLLAVVRVLGSDYRQRMIAALAAGSDPNRHTYAALLAFNEDLHHAGAGNFAQHLRAALDARPDDPFVWHLAAVYCRAGEAQALCAFPQAASTLSRLDADNLYPWLLQFTDATDPAAARALLHAAAQRRRFDDYSLASFAAYPRAVEAAGVRAPPLIAHPVQWLAPQERPERIIALLFAADFPLQPYRELTRFCGDATQLADATVRADCLAVGERLLRSDTSAAIVAQMIGVAVVRGVDPTSALAAEALAKRRLYRYTASATGRLSRQQLTSYPSGRFLQDLASVGELDAWRRRLAYFGLPDTPPADWQPDDPASLMTSRERRDDLIEHLRQAQAALDAGRFDATIATLAPLEARARATFDRSSGSLWRLPGFLATLGKARARLGHYAQAGANLDEAYTLFRAMGPAYRREASDCAAAMVALYRTRDGAEPGQGYAQRAGEWQRRQDDLAADGPG